MEDKNRSFEILEDKGILQLHAYKVTLSTGERIIKLPYVKTSAITAILFGSATEFRDIFKEAITPDGISFDIGDVKKRAILKALDLLNREFMMNILLQLKDVADIVLTEYDGEGKLIIKGNCNMLFPEDIKIIADVVIYDIGDVIKNVFGVGVKKTSPARKKEKVEVMPEEKSETELL
jgi:hypothetical protein